MTSLRSDRQAPDIEAARNVIALIASRLQLSSTAWLVYDIANCAIRVAREADNVRDAEDQLQLLFLEVHHRNPLSTAARLVDGPLRFWLSQKVTTS